ncbi:MAG: hypothetical protein PUG71_00120 [bacterium]|nr:hypothetical protein [bacterium]
MSELLVWRDKIRKIYARYSIYIDKAVQFLFAFVTFFSINKNIGVMEKVTSPVIAVGLAIVCTVLPPVCTVLVAAALVLLHMFKISLGIMAVSAVVFFIMFAFYCQFTPKRALVLLVTPIAYMLHIPYVVPVVCGLAFGPVISIPVIFGTIIYYMIHFFKNSASAISSAGGIMGEITLFSKNVFMNKEMWIACVAAVVCVCVVYTIRRLSIEHAWPIAIIAGALLNIIVFIVGSLVMGISVSYSSLLIGNAVAVLVGLVMQFFLFNVDYSRTETMQFEDDDYYYYVKAVPKLTISAPDKVVKHISEKNTEQILLEKSLQEELEIQNIINKELKE